MFLPRDKVTGNSKGGKKRKINEHSEIRATEVGGCVCPAGAREKIRSIHFILLHFVIFKQKSYQLRKMQKTIQISIYIYIKPWKLAGLSRDRALGRMRVGRNLFSFLLNMEIVELILISNRISFLVFEPE